MKSKKNTAAIVILLSLLTIAFSEKNLLSHGGFSTPFTGIGISYEYACYKNKTDQSLYVTAKQGSYSFLSYFLTVDLGHRFNNNDVVYRISGEAYMGPGIFGIHAGISNKYYSGSGDYYDGKSISYGITSALLFNPSLFIIGGQEKINNNTHENFIRASLMYNFRTEMKLRL